MKHLKALEKQEGLIKVNQRIEKNKNCSFTSSANYEWRSKSNDRPFATSR